MTNQTEWEKFKNSPEEYAKSLKPSRPWDFLNPNTEYADGDVTDARMDICMECPKFIKVTKQCKECGCFMNLKTRLAHATCPDGKW